MHFSHVLSDPESQLGHRRIIKDDILSRASRVQMCALAEKAINNVCDGLMCLHVVAVVNRCHILHASDSRHREMSTDIQRPSLQRGVDPQSSGPFDGVRVVL